MISKSVKQEIRDSLLSLLAWDAELARAEAERERQEKERKERELKEKEEREKKEREEREAREAAKKAAEKKDEKKEEEKKEEKKEEEKKDAKKPPPVPPPKVTRGLDLEAFFTLLASVLLFDRKEFPKARQIVTDLISKITRLPVNKRHDLLELQALAYFYASRIDESMNVVADNRPFYLDAYRVACLQRDDTGQATLINILLRSWIIQNQNRDAILFHEKTVFPQGAAPAQHARHLYYLGRLYALQSEYQKASTCLAQALTKAPQSARGFHIATHKLLCIVELLHGEIPQRQVFNQKGRGALKPYFELSRAVREGRLASFKRVMDDYDAAFQRDGMANFVIRLRRNVLNTGLRRICAAYSSISLVDIATKLHLDTPADAEPIVAKAISEGVIQAVIDHDTQYVQTIEAADLYHTFQPETQLHKRIGQCVETRAELLRSLRYLNTRDKEEEDEQARKEREELEKELATYGEDVGEDEGDDLM